MVWKKGETSELEPNKEFRMNSVTLLKLGMIVVTLLHPYRCQLKKMYNLRVDKYVLFGALLRM